MKAKIYKYSEAEKAIELKRQQGANEQVIADARKID